MCPTAASSAHQDVITWHTAHKQEEAKAQDEHGLKVTEDVASARGSRCGAAKSAVMQTFVLLHITAIACNEECTCSPRRERGVSSSATALSSMVVPWLDTERCRAMEPACHHIQPVNAANGTCAALNCAGTYSAGLVVRAGSPDQQCRASMLSADWLLRWASTMYVHLLGTHRWC